MSKTLLTLDDDYDFSLIGISCHAKDYRICWELNNSLKIALVRSSDYEINKKNEVSSFSFYEFNDTINYLDFYLIANKSSKGYLISEQKTIDFFLLLKGNISNNQLNNFLTKVKNIEIVLTAFIINPENLKSKQNLLF